MTEIPNRSNFFSTIDSEASCKQIAKLYKSAGWQVHKCSWMDFELCSNWGELLVKSGSPILLTGNVADIPARARNY